MHHHHHHAYMIISTLLCNSCTIAGPLPPVTAHKMASDATQTETLHSTHSLRRIKSPDKGEANNKVCCGTHPSDTHKPLLGLPARTFLVNMRKEGGPTRSRSLHQHASKFTSSIHPTLPSTRNPAYNKGYVQF